MRSLLVILLAISGCAHDHGAAESSSSDLDQAWMKLIEAKFAPSCSVALKKVGYVVAAVNGYRDEQWFFETCQGEFEYRVEYYPPEAFPTRVTPYEIIQVAPPDRGDGA